ILAQIDKAIARIFGHAHHAGLVDLVAAVGAVGEHLQEPAVLDRIAGRAQNERRVLLEQPFSGLERDAGSSPGRGVAGRDLAGIGETRFQCRAFFAVDNGYLMTELGEVVSGRNADDAAAEDGDLHVRLLSYAFMSLAPLST